MSEASIFIQALELAPEEREAFLRETCGGDAALRKGVAALLREHEEKAGPLDESLEGIRETIRMSAAELEAAASQTPSRVAAEHEPPSASIVVESDGKRVLYFGDYELKGEIARGAMGVVYRAEQNSLKRMVAIKMIRLDPAEQRNGRDAISCGGGIRGFVRSSEHCSHLRGRRARGAALLQHEANRGRDVARSPGAAAE